MFLYISIISGNNFKQIYMKTQVILAQTPDRVCNLLDGHAMRLPTVSKTPMRAQKY